MKEEDGPNQSDQNFHPQRIPRVLHVVTVHLHRPGVRLPLVSLYVEHEYLRRQHPPERRYDPGSDEGTAWRIGMTQMYYVRRLKHHIP